MQKDEKKKLRFVIVTQEDLFYIPEFLKRFLQAVDFERFSIPLVAVLPPFNESFFSLLKRMYSFYGPLDFVQRGFLYVIAKFLDRLGLMRRSVRSIANWYNIPVKKVLDVNDPAFIDELRLMELDVILSVAAPQIFREELLKTPKWGCINVHSAKLPKYRGMMPNFWAMYHGDSTAGITIHTMDEKIDRGKIILQSEIPIHPSESLDSLIKRSKRAAADLAIQALEQIRNGTVQLRDYAGEGSYFSFPKPEHVRELKARGHRLL